MMEIGVSKMAGNRPKAILAIEIVSVLLFFCDLVLAEFNGWLGTAIEIAMAGLLLALALLATRRRNAIARLALTIFFIAGAAFASYLAAFDELALSDFVPIELAILVAAVGMTVAQLALLWSRSASQWIAQSYSDISGSSAQQG